MGKVNFALIWKEEQRKLREMARLIPQDGTIVEIGTANGGTARIFYNAARNKKARIYTIDKLRNPKAGRNLQGTGVRIINSISAKYAGFWGKNMGRRIDLLYIDGDHTLKGVCDDFNGWAVFLKPGGKIVFHDYDPAIRGGMAHLGVKVAVDAAIKKGLLTDVKHEYKLLSGKIKEGSFRRLIAEDCLKAFLDIQKRSAALTGRVFSRSIKSGMRILKNREISFDSVQACYCIEHALREDFSYLDGIARPSANFRRWSEMLYTFEHACSGCITRKNGQKALSALDIGEMSRFIAGEQVRITILSLVLRTLVDWEP